MPLLEGGLIPGWLVVCLVQLSFYRFTYNVTVTKNKQTLETPYIATSTCVHTHYIHNVILRYIFIFYTLVHDLETAYYLKRPPRLPRHRRTNELSRYQTN